jgi:hypothetical protein
LSGESFPGLSKDAGAMLGGYFVCAVGDILVQHQYDFRGPAGDAFQGASNPAGFRPGNYTN